MNTFNRILAAILFFAFNPAEARVPQTETDKSENLKFDPFGKDLTNTTSNNFQFSVLPSVGTNGRNSGNVINHYSFNLLGGYSAGTTKLELAGLFNINRGDMSGVQMAGWFNQVGGKVEGVQLAGLFNSNLDSVKGVQLAGLTNFTTGAVEGVQIAGLANFSPKNVIGVQIAGITNFSAADLEGSQLSGVLNFTAGNVKGSQLGLVNFANKVDGFQLGLINYSDSISGIPVGFLSFVRVGYHPVEISVNEVLPLNLAFRTGKGEFYNIFFAGLRPEWDDQLTWSFGYGIGTSPRLGKKTYLNIEVSSEQLSKGELEALNLVNRFYLGAEFQANKRLAVFAGPTLNFRVYDTSFNDHPQLFTFATPTVHNEQFYPEDLGSQLWLGFRAGIRFF